MKQLLIAVLLLIAVGLKTEAQEKKKDSIQYVPVYIVDHVDTVKVPTLFYKGPRNKVKWSSPGYLIRKGKAIRTNKGFEWTEEPQPIGGLDDKKRTVKL